MIVKLLAPSIVLLNVTALLLLVMIEPAARVAAPFMAMLDPRPLVVILPPIEIKAPVADRAPNGVDPTAAPNVIVPLPAWRVRAGFATTPSPFRVLLKVMLRLPLLASRVIFDAVKSL